jgi:two-component system sensor histidine kinase/response regulator
MIARALAAAVDRDLDNGETAARALAGQPSLASGDLAAFHTAARRLLRPEFPVFGVASARPTAPTCSIPAMPSAPCCRPRQRKRRARRIRPRRVHHVRPAPRRCAAQPWVISITVPVWREGKVAYAVTGRTASAPPAGTAREPEPAGALERARVR